MQTVSRQSGMPQAIDAKQKLPRSEGIALPVKRESGKPRCGEEGGTIYFFADIILRHKEINHGN